MIAQFFSAELAVVIPIVILALIGFAIVALVTARRDLDPTGSRPYAVYLVLIIFFSMFTALFALTSVASNVAKIAVGRQAIGPGRCGPTGYCPLGFTRSSSVLAASGSGSGSTGPPGHRFPPRFHRVSYDPRKQQTASAVEAALVALVALGMLWFHVGRLRELVQEPEFTRSPGRRTYQVYLHAVTFTSAAILVFAVAAALYAIFRIAAPGYSEQLAPANIERDGGIVQLASAGVLALGAWAIFRYHWRRTRTLRGETPVPSGDRDEPPGPAPPPAAPPAPPEAATA
jgi:hypothetical protein